VASLRVDDVEPALDGVELIVVGKANFRASDVCAAFSPFRRTPMLLKNRSRLIALTLSGDAVLGIGKSGVPCRNSCAAFR
jgi:hypothetical protein